MLIVVIGAGEVGFNVAARLAREFKDIVVIDKDQEKLERVSELIDVRTICGSGSSISVLRSAEIERADILIAATDSDEVNMVSCLVAGLQSRVPKKIARIRDPEYANNSRLMGPERLGIDLVVNTNREVVENIVRVLEVPWAKDVVDLADGRIRLASFVVDGSHLMTGRRLEDLRRSLPDPHLVVAALIRGERAIIPRGEDKIEPNDLVYLLGTREAIGRVFHNPNTLESRPTRRAMIFGGSSMALEVAKGLEAKDVQVSIVDPSEERCEFLASQLDGATVLKGDFTSTDLMREEGVDRADVFMALTGEDEKNIILCLLAKRLGCRRVLALANRLQYVSLAYQGGVDVVVSPSVIAINKILQFVRRGRVANVVTLPEGQAEIIEVEALETSDLVSSPIKDLRLPRGILVGAVTRGQEVIIPTGDTRIDPGDKVAMVVSSDSLKLLERVVSVKLDYW